MLALYVVILLYCLLLLGAVPLPALQSAVVGGVLALLIAEGVRRRLR